MRALILTAEQTEFVTQHCGPFKIRDAHGNDLGTLDPPLTPQMIAELKRRARQPGPRYTGAQVSAMLAALEEEKKRIGPFDEAYLFEFLARWDQANPPLSYHPGQAG